VLSRDGERACADCHRPELALTDGRATALPARSGDSAAVLRNTPTLYNVALKRRLFWDRRSPNLEAQVFEPLFSPNEMGADPVALLARLRAIPEYVKRFGNTFDVEAGAPHVTLENLAAALAAFERTLVSQNSRYDRWAAGQRDALTAKERRGLRLFRSLNTRCFECHVPPAFDTPLALGIGIPSSDPGVAGITGNAARAGHFAVPSLRNVARTAPYMHDGSIETLEEVVEFYREGGGRVRGVPRARVNSHVRAFDIEDSEAADLVAFLRSLTDESARPTVPDAVPSGLEIPGASRGPTHQELRR
jgi:cytochrome c peroxidase